MPLYPPRTLAPVKQLESLAKREAKLRDVLSRNSTPTKLEEATEKVRMAQLSVLKARISLLEHQPDSPSRRRELESIAKSEQHWLGLSASDIQNEYSAAFLNMS